MRPGPLGAPAGPQGVGEPEARVDEDQGCGEGPGAKPRTMHPLVADLAAAELCPAADTAASADEMHYPRGRQAGDLPAQFFGAVAPIDFFVVHEVARVQRAHLADGDPREHHAGTLDPVDLRA